MAEAVARAAHGFQVMAPERCVDLAPEVVDVLVDDVRGAVVGDVPSGFEDLGPRENGARVAQEQLEETELLGRQFDLGRSSPDPL